jgi:hypothetical protein
MWCVLQKCGPPTPHRTRAPTSPSRYSPTRRNSNPNVYVRPESSQNDERIFVEPSPLSPRSQQQQQQPPSQMRGHHTRSLPPFPTASRRHHPRTGSFSFDVLKSDPETTSLEHLASSTTLRTGSAKVGRMTDGRKGVTSGSAPAFRVSMAAAPLMGRRGGRPDDPMMGQDGDQNWKRAAAAAADLDGHHHHAYARSPTGTPALIQFSVAPSSSPTVSPTSTTTTRKNHYKKPDVSDPGPSLDRDKGKKHECPHCSKRFNRPSSLRIHVNTHTGLKRTPPFILRFLSSNVHTDDVKFNSFFNLYKFFLFFSSAAYSI